MEEQTVLSFFSASLWSPYLVGVGIGVLSWISFLFSNKPLGVSSALANSAGMIEKAIRGPKTLSKPYYQEHVPKSTGDGFSSSDSFSAPLPLPGCQVIFNGAWFLICGSSALVTHLYSV